MSSPIDLDQQRKNAEFRRRASRGQNWFFGLFMVYILILGLWMFVARPAFADSPDPAIQRLLASGVGYNALMALSVVESIPIFLAFLLFREQLMTGIRLSGFR